MAKASVPKAEQELPTGDPHDFLHPLQKYTARTIWRQQIRNADYNPRVITDAARKKLKQGLEKLGLLQPLVWNGRTSNLVGGHQRLELLDKLANGKKTFALQVAEVDLNPAEEVEANILLNNPETHGMWDLAKLDAALRTEGLRVEATGFDMGDLVQVLGESPFALEHGQELAALANAQRLTTDAIDEVNARLRGSRDNDNFFVVLVFRDNPDVQRFLTALGLEPNTFQDGKRMHELLEPLYAKQRADQAAIADDARKQVAAELEAAIARDALMRAKPGDESDDPDAGDDFEDDEGELSDDDDQVAAAKE